MCGGTFIVFRSSGSLTGLSPRVRGNRRVGGGLYELVGSIPACAGEPSCSSSSCPSRGVYPRVCGGTGGIFCRVAGSAGLSPRVRGNHERSYHFRRYARSIPACAGEPGFASIAAMNSKVYPRVCGGTRMNACWTRITYGLSPRVRGNLAGAQANGRIERSIPACAGEPNLSFDELGREPVYPRVCGGTTIDTTSALPATGLSPRVRGNRAWLQVSTHLFGSIPACAGEP